MTLIVGGEKIALDTKDSAATLNFISHAHTDHIRGARSKIKTIASAETKEFLKVRNNINIQLAELGQGMELLPAGHILGSKQLYIESEDLGYSVVYTGDYQLQETLAAERIKIKPADVVIMDSTYTQPGIEFDDRDEVISAMNSYLENKLGRGIILFGAYSLGKAQELIKICNNIGIKPCVMPTIDKVSQVYNEFGMGLEYDAGFDELEHTFKRESRENFVGIVNNRALRDVAAYTGAYYSRRVFTAVATGWAKSMRFGTDVQFPLSDHADFKQAKSYIEQSGAKFVYTYGGNSDILAENLRKEGYNAEPFKKGIELSPACRLQSKPNLQ